MLRLQVQEASSVTGRCLWERWQRQQQGRDSHKVTTKTKRTLPRGGGHPYMYRVPERGELTDRMGPELDPETGDFVRSFFESYQKEKGTSILLASHNMTEVERLCSSVLMMNNGSIIDQGSPEKLIQKHGRKNMEEVFLKLTREKV